MSLRSVNTELPAAHNVASYLEKSLAETKLETSKAQTFHWNVKGMAFGALHDLFQEIYEDHFEAEDTLAERLRALDLPADGRLSKSLATGTLAESGPDLRAEQMIADLAADQRHLSETLRALASAADVEDDQITADMAIERAQIHEKFAWMLRAHLAA